jgi:hypothetical protein
VRSDIGDRELVLSSVPRFVRTWRTKRGAPEVMGPLEPVGREPHPYTAKGAALPAKICRLDSKKIERPQPGMAELQKRRPELLGSGLEFLRY